MEHKLTEHGSGLTEAQQGVPGVLAHGGHLVQQAEAGMQL